MLKKFKKLLEKDENPCSKCLVFPCCSLTCEIKLKWDSGEHSFMLPFYLILGCFILFAFMSAFLITFILFKLGLADNEDLQRFNPFEEEEEYYYN
jgi:hypothetical protein